MTRNRMLSDSEEQVICARYVNGESVKEILEDYMTISRSTIFNILRRNGISCHPRCAFTYSEEQDIIARYRGGESIREIHRDCKYSYDSVVAVLHRNNIKLHPFRGADISGRQYNCLTVIRFHSIQTIGAGRNRGLWLCRCVCGNEILLTKHNLTSGNNRSCGCAFVKHLTTDPRQANINAVILRIKHDASTRCLVFELSKERAVEMMESNCHYCGVEPSMNWAGTNPFHPFAHNGIDRIDSSIGYTEDNTVPCCKICNRAKNNSTYADFIAWIERISTHTRSFNLP